MPLLILIVADTMAVWFLDWDGIPALLTMFFLWGPIFALISYALFPAYEFRQSIKEELLSGIARFYGDEWSYQIDNGFDENIIKSSDIKPHYRNFYCEDCFTGAYQGVKIAFAEVCLTTPKDEDNKTQVHFRGLCLLFSMNKRFDGKTVVVQDQGGGWFNRNKKQLGDMQRIELEDPEFEAMFEVYGTDQVEARYLLTTAFMDRTLQLSRFVGESGARAEIQFEFRDQNLFMMIPSSVDYFEPASVFEPAVQIEDTRKFLKEMTLIFGVVDALKLNLKLGL